MILSRPFGVTRFNRRIEPFNPEIEPFIEPFNREIEPFNPL